MERVKSILVSQPRPDSDKNHYAELIKKHGVRIDFRPFIHVEGVDVVDFRAQKVNILEHGAVIFTSKNAADHYFRICEEMRVNVPETMKYFCMSEAIAFYLQKYVVFRKRKIFHGKQTFQDLIDILRKHKEEKFLLPCSDIMQKQLTDMMDKYNLKYTKTVIYKTVSSDLSDLADVNYDVLVFFSPAGIQSLFENFPDFKQNATRIAAFGPTTCKAVRDAGLRLDIGAPVPNAPSMTMALEHYLSQSNKKK